MSKALKREGESDYVLKEEHTSVWITVDNISVYVRRTDEGVAVDLYPLGEEMEGSLVGTWALFSEAEAVIDEVEELMREQVTKNSPPSGKKSCKIGSRF